MDLFLSLSVGARIIPVSRVTASDGVQLAHELVETGAFAGVVVWAFGRKRKARFEKDARIPFEDGKD